MKKTIILISFMVLGAIGLNAQTELGLGLGYGADIEELGIQARADFQVVDNISVAPNVTYYLDGVDNISFWEFNVDGHYNFDTTNSIMPYLLAGLNVAAVTTSISGFDGDTDVGVNLGAGAKYGITDNFKVFLEPKYTIGGTEQFSIFGGLLFGLN